MQQVLLHPLPETLVTGPQQSEGTVGIFRHKLIGNQIRWSIQQIGMLFPEVTQKPLKHLLHYKPEVIDIGY